MIQIRRPAGLRQGGRIGIAAASGPVDETRLARGIASLEEKGYEVVEAANLRRREGFLAGSDEERAAGYRELLLDPDVDAIFFARGGYGASRLLGRLDQEEVRANPKIHLGGSDLTALFAFLWARARLVTFYGPMVAVQMAKVDSLDWEGALRGAVPEAHRFSPVEVLSAGEGEGPLVGGCLSLLASLAGTPEAVRGEDAVLFWEDVGEETYRLDRMLTQLERSGTFEGLHAMVIGSIAPGGRSGLEPAEDVSSWLQRRFANAPFPVVFGFPAGHLSTPRTIPLGCRVRLNTADPPELVFLEAGVETQ